MSQKSLLLFFGTRVGEAEVFEVFMSPVAHGEDDRDQRLPELRQTVFRFRRHDGVELPVDYAIRLQLA